MGHPLKRIEGEGKNSKQTNSSPPQHSSSRVPPNTLEAEESVIGAILLDNNAIDMVLERLIADDFYQPRYRVLFEGMKELHEKGQPIDVVTLGQVLRAKGELENVGGLEELSRLAAIVPSSAHVSYYAKLLKEMSIRRRIIHETAEISREAFDLGENIESFLDTAEQRILNVSDFRVRPTFHKVGDVVQSSISIIEELYHRKEPSQANWPGIKMNENSVLYCRSSVSQRDFPVSLYSTNNLQTDVWIQSSGF